MAKESQDNPVIQRQPTEKYHAKCTALHNRYKIDQSTDPEGTPEFYGWMVSNGVDGETANMCSNWAQQAGG